MQNYNSTKFLLPDWIQNIYLNPEHIIFMSEDVPFKQDLIEGKINLGLDENISFTKIKINENSGFSEIVVVGSPDIVENKIFNNSKRRLLKS